MNERVEYTYAYFMHIINVWVSGVSPPALPTFLLVSPPLPRVISHLRTPTTGPIFCISDHFSVHMIYCIMMVSFLHTRFIYSILLFSFLDLIIFYNLKLTI